MRPRKPRTTGTTTWRPRTTPYRPETHKLDLPIDLENVLAEYGTLRSEADDRIEHVTGDWKNVGVDIWIREDHGVSTCQGTKRGGPSWDLACQQKTFDLDTGMWLKIDDEATLRDPSQVNRELPPDAKNIRTELYMTVFEILPQ